jgi:hypothetical protein
MVQKIKVPFISAPAAPHLLFSHPSPELFVNLLRSPGIDSQPYFSYRPVRLHRLAESITRNRFGGPVQQPYLSYRPARLHRLAESISGLLKRLQLRALPGALRKAYIYPQISASTFIFPFKKADLTVLCLLLKKNIVSSLLSSFFSLFTF